MLKSKNSALPYVIWSGVFIVVPLILVVIFAFTTSDGQFTIKNITAIGKYSPIFIKSLNLALIATVICLLLAFPLAFLLTRMEEKNQSLLLILLMLPMWMNFLLRTYGWMTLIENEGIINSFFRFIGIGTVQMINTQGAVVLGMVYNYIPFMILPLYSIMVKIDKSTIEAAQDLGANSISILFKVIIPLSTPGIVSGVTMVFVPSVSTFIISKMLGGGSNMLIGDLIEQQFFGTYNPNLGSGIALILMIIMLLLMGIMTSLDDNAMEGMIV